MLAPRCLIAELERWMKFAFGLRRRSIVALLKRNDETENGLLLLAFDSFQRFEGGSANGGVFSFFFVCWCGFKRVQPTTTPTRTIRDEDFITLLIFLHSFIRSFIRCFEAAPFAWSFSNTISFQLGPHIFNSFFFHFSRLMLIIQHRMCRCVFQVVAFRGQLSPVEFHGICFLLKANAQ